MEEFYRLFVLMAITIVIICAVIIIIATTANIVGAC